MPNEAEVSPETVQLKLGRKTVAAAYKAGDTVLETARRAGLNPPFSCEQGNCGTCMAHLDEGTVRMRANNVLMDDELEEGWILTCQAEPTSPVTIEFEAM